MILLDCGNSQVKAQHWRGETLQNAFSCRYRPGWSKRLGAWLEELAAKQAYLASVLGATSQAELDRCLAKYFATRVTRFTSSASALGIHNGYTEPQRLGVDRWLAMLGAAALVGGDCIVIDAGSAITIDLLRADGQHLGGAILAGVNTSRDDFKRIFSHIDFNDPALGQSEAPGSSTETAIRIDYAHSSIEEVTSLVQRWRKHLANDARILLAGGDAAQVQRALEQPSRIFPDLVFCGMRRLATA